MILEGERELYASLEKHEKAATQAAMEGLKNAGLNIIADAKEYLRGNHSVVTGQLRASGRVQKAQDDKQAFDAGFFSKNSNGHAFFVEYGRRSGKMPPVDYLMEWLRKKSSAFKSASVLFRKGGAGLDLDKALRAQAYALAKVIAKRGTRPHPFFAPAIQKNEQAIADAIAQEVQKEIR